MVRHDCTTELRNVVFEINQVFALLVRNHIVEVNILVSPLKVVDNPLVGELFLDDKDVLKEINDSLIYVEMVEFRNHSLLVFQVSLILVDQSISFINDASNVIKSLHVGLLLQFRQGVIQSLILALLSFQFEVHVFDLCVVALKFSQDHFFVLAVAKFSFDLVEIAGDFGKFIAIRLLHLRLL